jgi:outer membrane immunogenic protein
MKKFLAAASAVTLMAVAAPAFAQIDGTIGYSKLDADGVDLGAVTGRLAWTANDIFGVEGEVHVGIDDDRQVVGGVATDVELKHAAAIYGTAGVPLGENGRVFGRVGYGTQKFEARAAGVTASDSDESFNYGVGAQFFLDGVNGIRGDFTKHDFDGGDIDVWSLSYVRRFR